MRPLVCAAAVVWFGVFAAHATCFDPNDGDLWWQRVLGATVLRQHAIPAVLGPSTYTAPEAPWIAHEWLFSTAYAWCVAHHAVLAFQLALAACAVAAIVLVAVRASARGGERYAGFAAVVCGVALIESFGVRAQVAAWPLLALFMLLFDVRGPVRFWAVAVTVVWANVHASVMLAPVIAAVGLLDARRPLRERLVMLAAVAGATFCTPFGAGLPAMALRWSFDPDAAFIVEWAHPSLTDWPFLIGGLLPAIVLLGEVRARALDWTQRITALLLVVAMIDHGRNLATAAIVIVPSAAVVLQALSGPGRARRWAWSDAGLVAIACAGAVIIAVQAARMPKTPYLPRAAVAATQARSEPQRVYCEDFSWCSLFAGDPAVRVYIDGRTDAYPHAVFAGWDRVRNAGAGWQHVLDAGATTTILARSHGVLAKAATRSRWRASYADRAITVFVRSPERR